MTVLLVSSQLNRIQDLAISDCSIKTLALPLVYARCLLCHDIFTVASKLDGALTVAVDRILGALDRSLVLSHSLREFKVSIVFDMSAYICTPNGLSFNFFPLFVLS